MTLRWNWVFIFIFFIPPFWGPATDTTAERLIFGPRYFTPSREVVTPHIPWARPYYAGKLNILFVAPRMSMREVVELAQRLDMEHTTCFTHMPKQLGQGAEAVGYQQVRGSFQEYVAKQLRDKLSGEYDLVVLGNINWDILPKSVRYRILSQVHDAGMGLVLSNVIRDQEELPNIRRRAKHQGEEYLLRLWPTGLTPRWQDKETKELFLPCVFGKVRVLFMESGSSPRQFLCPPPIDIDEPRIDYDYYLAVAIRGLLWAADREPDVTVTRWPKRLDRESWPQSLAVSVINHAGARSMQPTSHEWADVLPLADQVLRDRLADNIQLIL